MKTRKNSRVPRFAMLAALALSAPVYAADSVIPAPAPSYPNLAASMGAARFSVPAAQPSLLQSDAVTQLCLARANADGTGALAADSLTPDQWMLFARCSIAANVRFAPGSITGNPAAVVRMDLDASGSIRTIVFQPSGDATYDAAVQRAIGAMPKLPPAPAGRSYDTVTLRYQVGPTNQGIAGAGGLPILSGSSHLSLHHRVGLGGASTCN